MTGWCFAGAWFLMWVLALLLKRREYSKGVMDGMDYVMRAVMDVGGAELAFKVGVRGLAQSGGDAPRKVTVN